MSQQISMPRLTDGMEEGTILAWLKQDGDLLVVGEEIAEVETDKATTVVEADVAGVLEVLVAAGETVAVGVPIANVGVPDEVGPAAGDAVPPPATDAAAAADTAPEPDGQRPSKASPLARRVAAAHGLDVATVDGSGPGGRVVRADVERAVAAPADAGRPASAAEATGPKGTPTVVELTRTQQLIARRMVESKRTIPEFSMSMDARMDALAEARERLKRTGGDVPSYNDVVIKATATALREFPIVNASYVDGSLEIHPRVNVGMAVATDGALLVPTVFDADVLPIAELGRTTRRLAERVRTGAITPAELDGGTFTVSNLGMLGVEEFTAVINPPQVAILAVGAIRSVLELVDGVPRAVAAMRLTLVSDHRVLYGADAARFLRRVKDLIETPLAIDTMAPLGVSA